MKPLYWTRILVPYQPPQPIATPDTSANKYVLFLVHTLVLVSNLNFSNYLSSTLWDKLEEIAPDSWDDFADLFSRQVVAAKPVKPKAESKPVKQQTIKSRF